jgi:SAM-dependent methyltransferase
MDNPISVVAKKWSKWRSRTPDREEQQSGQTHSFKAYDIPIDLMLLTGGGPETFAQISDSHQYLLKRWIDLKPSDNVLEIGCGIGRDAIPVSEFLTSGRYTGIDIIKPSIDWCTSTIGAKHINVTFIHFDVKDQLHNSEGVLDARNVILPMPDGSVDKIFLFSVFTHMLRPEIEHYLNEFRRVIRPDGRIYATTFLFDDKILASSRENNRTPFNLRFEHEVEPGCRINDPMHPLGAVAYSREVWDTMVKRSGLRYSRPFLRGAWSGFYKDPDEGQDVALLELDR